MPKLSKEKQQKIQEQILYFLFSSFPKQVFTVEIAREIARDEEFVKSLLINMEKQELLVKIDKNLDGVKYERRSRWRISNKAYEVYNQHQLKSSQNLERIEKNLQ